MAARPATATHRRGPGRYFAALPFVTTWLAKLFKMACQPPPDGRAPPYSDFRGWGVQRKWSNFFEHADLFVADMLGAALSAPVTLWIRLTSDTPC